MNIEIKDKYMEQLSRSSKHTRTSMAFYAGKFLNFAEGRPLSEWNGSIVREFLASLEKEGYSPGTVRTVYAIVKRVFDAAKMVHEEERQKKISSVNPDDPGAVAHILQALSIQGPQWDLGKRSAPSVDSHNVLKPAHTLEEISQMVQACRDGRLSSGEAVYLAFATIYGLRREELCRIRKEHIDLTGNTFYVMTCKGGEKREQLLCDDILPLMGELGEFSLFLMSSLYWRICYKSGVKIRPGYGWHSFRRYLDTALVDQFGQLQTHIFLRWKLSSSSFMTERYYSHSPLEIDRIVLEGHPIVPLWR